VKADVTRLKNDVDSVIARFVAVAARDRRLMWTTRVLATLTIIGVVASLGFLALADTLLRRPQDFLLGLAILAGVTAVLGVGWRAVRREDLDDRKLRTIQRVLRILRADIPKDAAVEVAIDLRSYDRGGEKVNTRGRVTKYRHEWLDLAVPLADGNVVSLTVTDVVKSKSRRRSTRQQWTTSVDVGVRLARRYVSAAEAARRLRARPTPSPLRLVAVAGRRPPAGARDRLEARLTSGVSPHGAELVSGDTLLALVQWLYAGLADTRRRA
jgi:hypothetical protein